MNPPSATSPPSPPDPAAILAIERPDPKLMLYYFICCLAALPLFPLLIIPNFFRYHTMRYRFDSEGISMRWGILFRREIILNYARIQDIHLTSNILERWLGLARIQIQTASGSSGPEMTLEGLLQCDAVRDFLYARMRGAKEKTFHPAVADAAPSLGVAGAGAGAEALIETLRAVAAELRAVREALGKRNPPQL